MARRFLGTLLAVAAGVSVLWVVLWWWGPDAWRPGWVALALTPLAVVGAAVTGLLALVTRRWPTAAVALLATGALAVVVVPRALGPDPGTPAPTGALVVTTANLQFGRADVTELVRLVATRRVDVLGLQELTPDEETRLAAAGLFALLPSRVTAARPGAGGVGLASRYPLASSELPTEPAEFAPVTARVLAPTGPVDVVVAHPSAPVFRDDPGGWAAEIRGLPDPAPAGAPARLIMGDLNATLDHRPLRDLIARGHRDVAAQLGDGLTATWPTDRPVPPFATIDHLLVSGPMDGTGVVTDRLAGSDHAAVTAVLAPRGR